MMRIVYSLIFEAEVAAEDEEILQANEVAFKESFAADTHIIKADVEKNGFKFLSYSSEFVEDGDSK